MVAGVCCFIAGAFLPSGVAAAGTYSDSVILRGNTVTAQAWSSLSEPPEACNGRRYATVTIGVKRSQRLTGGPKNDLIVGLGAAAVLRGGEADDCIVAGPAASEVDGGPGYDVCVVGAGVKVVTGCEVTLRLPTPRTAGSAPRTGSAPGAQVRVPAAQSPAGQVPAPAAPAAPLPSTSATATQSPAPAAQTSEPPAVTTPPLNDQIGSTP